MAAAVQRSMGARDFWQMQPLVLSVDAGGLMARRILEAKIKAQSTRASEGSVKE